MRSPLAYTRLHLVLAAATAIPALASVGCSGSASSGSTSTGTEVAATVTRDLSPSVSTSDESSLVTGNTDFAFALYHGIGAQAGSTTSNLFYSPYSVSLALAMTYAGAHGETATQMASALSLTLAPSALHPAFDKLDLAIQQKPANASGADGAPFAINLADSLWGDESVTFQQTFVNTLAANYAAGLRTVSFATAPSSAESAINGWVASETNDKIDPLLQPDAITADTKFVIVNAVYFDAAWATQFQTSQTANGAFTRADGSTVQAPLMSSGEAATTYYKGPNYQAVELPYSGGTASMIVVLPDTGAYADVESKLGASLFTEATSGLSGDAQINLTIPKFKIHGGTISLVPELQALGMSDAFDPNAADFTSMIPAGNVYISDVLHQAFVDVDESGTEAAAATAVIGVGTAAFAKQVTVDVNRAFFFFIRDVASNSILFVGRESDPTAE